MIQALKILTINFYGNIKHFVGTRHEIRLADTVQQDTEKIKIYGK